MKGTNGKIAKLMGVPAIFLGAHSSAQHSTIGCGF